MADWSPGKRTIRRVRGGVDIMAEGKLIGCFYDDTVEPEELMANVRLAASGPEMFDALRRARTSISNAIEMVGSPAGAPEWATLFAIDELIAKVEGRR